MPPSARPFPRFIAEPSHEGEPYGRWEERLAGLFAGACETVEEAPGAPGAIAWHPQRTWAGRVFVPATAPCAAGAGGGARDGDGGTGADGDGELFGIVSYAPAAEGGEPDDFAATADHTDETAAVNPEWKIDLCDEAIGRWRGPGGAEADISLVWGTPLVPGAVIATAELDGETVDQCEIGESGRFTLVALDAVTGFGDNLYLEVAVWGRRGEFLAAESVYEEDGG